MNDYEKHETHDRVNISLTPSLGYTCSSTTLGLEFLSIFVACLPPTWWNFLLLLHEVDSHREPSPQRSKTSRRMPPPCTGSLCVSSSRPFLFGWPAHRSIHWIVSLLGVTIYATGVYIILQCLSVYLPRIYPSYAASLFAANDLCRSVAAAGLILAGIPLYGRLGIERRISVLGAIGVLGIPGMWFIYLQGPRLRAKSILSRSESEVPP